MSSYSENFKLAVGYFKRNNFEKAIELFKTTIREYPSDYRSYNYIAVSYASMGKFLEALNYFEKVLEINPKLEEAYSNMGIIYSKLNYFNEARKSFQKGLAMNPNNPFTIYNMAVANKEIGSIIDAIHCYQKCLEISPKFYRAKFNLSLLKLMVGNYNEGWEAYESGFASGNRLKPKFKGVKWQGEELNGKRIYVVAEQGYGDTLQFSRYLPLIKSKGGKVIFECQAPLIPILKQVKGYDEIVAQRNDLLPATGYDYYIPLLSLPYIFSTTIETIPDIQKYLRVDNNYSTKWKEKINDTKKIKIGITWKGNPNHKEDKKRSCEIEKLLPLFALKNIEFYSLQMGANDIEKKFLKKNNAIDFTSDIENFSDTAAIISHLDLVISVDTVVTHLTASMGKTVWLMLPFVADWRWLIDRNDSPWYDTIRIFRQPELADWKGLIENIKFSLEEFENRFNQKK